MDAGDPLSVITLIAQSVDESTGLGRIASALAAEYAKCGYGVHIVSQRCESTPGIWHRVPGYAITPAAGKIAFRLFERSITGTTGASVLHAFGVGAAADIVSAQSCHKAAVKLQKSRGRQRIVRRNFGLYDRLSLGDERRLFLGPRRKRIVAVSRLVRQQILEEYDIPENAVSILPNGVHLARFNRENMRQGVGGEGGVPFTLLFVGNEFDRKGLQTVIESLPLVAEIPLEVHIAGNDDPAPYIRRAEELGVSDRLRFLGSISSPESLFPHADALVFPTHYEPFGMVIMEAMAAGIPVITSRMAGAVEGLTDGVHGLYLDDPLSAQELAKSVRTLVENKTLRGTLGRNGRAAAEQYAWPVIAARFLELYRSLGS